MRRAARAAVRALAAGRSWLEVEIDVPDGSLRLASRATYADGRQFRGRLGAILVGEKGEHRSLLPETEPDSEWGFAFRGLAPGLVHLTARIAGSLRIVGPAWRVPA